MATNYFELNSDNHKIGHDFLTSPARPEGASGALLFAQNEEALWEVTVPDYSSGLTLDIPYYMASVNSGNLDLDVDIMKIQDGDEASVETASFAAVNNQTDTVPGTALYPGKITVVCSNDDSPDAGIVTFFIRITRKDALSGDLKMLDPVATYTTVSN